MAFGASREFRSRFKTLSRMDTPVPAPSRRYHSPARKSLGQHFLVDARVRSRIIRAAELSRGDVVVEVGPGRGFLTAALAERAGKVVGIELDHNLAERLAQRFDGSPNVAIVAADAREVHFDEFLEQGTAYKVVANLPYYAASPIVRRFLESSLKPAMMVVMLQREVAEEMAAKPGKMGLLSVATQLYGRPRIVCNVPPRAFRPAPKITSTVVRIDVYPRPAIRLDSVESFFHLVKAGFSARRKQIRNSLRLGLDLSPEDTTRLLNQAGIDPTRRPQTLGLEEWGTLYQAWAREPLTGQGADHRIRTADGV